MTGLRLPGRIAIERASAATGLQPIEQELLAEMASSLGHAGRKAEAALAALREIEAQLREARAAGRDGDLATERETRLRQTARAAHAYFIQRELCGMRRHDDVIREMAIPRAVLVRLGAQ